MWALAASLLACPRCRGSIGSHSSATACAGCGLPFSLRGPVMRLLPAGEGTAQARRTVHAFERQWQAYGRLPRLFGKDAQAMARNLVGARMGGRIDAAWYAGRRVLDAGCGHGRYVQAFAALGAQVVGLDLGRGPELVGAALENPSISWVQGSVLAPPFVPRAFDLVFSDGVLHHTPDPRRAYLALAELVKPGGALYVWVYPREGRAREAVFRAARALTTRLPGPALRTLCLALAPLTLGVRSYSGTNLARASWGECAQVIHDWLAPPLQSHHDIEELEGWAREAGLSDGQRLPIPTGLVAWRPPEAGS